jgi:hypothetical protein
MGGGASKQQVPLRLRRFGMTSFFQRAAIRNDIAFILESGKRKTLPYIWKGLQVARGRLAAAYVRCLEAFRALQQVELDSFALVESAIAVFLDGGEMNEHILARGPLDESVTFGSVKPLHCAFLSHN